MTSINIWKETIVYDELTIIECQKSDTQFFVKCCRKLDKAALQQKQETLKSRVISTTYNIC